MRDGNCYPIEKAIQDGAHSVHLAEKLNEVLGVLPLRAEGAVLALCAAKWLAAYPTSENGRQPRAKALKDWIALIRKLIKSNEE